MENKLKHYWYVCDGGRGRVAARVEYDKFELHQTGRAAPAGVLRAIVKDLLGDDGMAEAHELHRNRQHRYATFVRTGVSGCRDYYLVEEKDTAWHDYPRHHLLHVSMAGKLNEAVSIWLGDLPVLLEMLPVTECAIEEAWLYEYEFKSANPQEQEDVEYLSQETLARLRAIEFVDDEDL